MRLKGSTITTIALLLYTVIMAIVGLQYVVTKKDIFEYVAIIIATLCVIFALRYVLRKREILRTERRKREDSLSRHQDSGRTIK